MPRLDAFGMLVFQVLGEQLSVAATRTILSRLVENFWGRLPPPAELLAADAQTLRDSGVSARKGATLRAIAERFVDRRLSDEVLAGMSDDEVEAALTEVPGVGPWTAHGFLLIALDRPDVFLLGDLALRRGQAGVRLRPRTNRTGDGLAGRSSTSRVVRNHPEEVSRCLVCERSHVRKVSQRVLELALGAL